MPADSFVVIKPSSGLAWDLLRNCKTRKDIQRRRISNISGIRATDIDVGEVRGHRQATGTRVNSGDTYPIWLLFCHPYTLLLCGRSAFFKGTTKKLKSITVIAKKLIKKILIPVRKC